MPVRNVLYLASFRGDRLTLRLQCLSPEEPSSVSVCFGSFSKIIDHVKVTNPIVPLGLASFLLTSLAVVQEITHPRNRVTIAHSWNSYWILGSVIANFTVFGTSYIASSWGWRIPYLMQVPMALYVSHTVLCQDALCCR
jgi:hypothetical protein